MILVFCFVNAFAQNTKVEPFKGRVAAYEIGSQMVIDKEAVDEGIIKTVIFSENHLIIMLSYEFAKEEISPIIFKVSAFKAEKDILVLYHINSEGKEVVLLKRKVVFPDVAILDYFEDGHPILRLTTKKLIVD